MRVKLGLLSVAYRGKTERDVCHDTRVVSMHETLAFRSQWQRSEIQLTACICCKILSWSLKLLQQLLLQR